MSEGRTLEIRYGDTVFICMAEGHCNMHYVEDGTNLEKVIEGFEQFLRGAGFHFDGHIEIGDVSAESQWAIDVRNFLDAITDPEVYGWKCGEDVRNRAAELRDA